MLCLPSSLSRARSLSLALSRSLTLFTHTQPLVQQLVRSCSFSSHVLPFELIVGLFCLYSRSLLRASHLTSHTLTFTSPSAGQAAADPHALKSRTPPLSSSASPSAAPRPPLTLPPFIHSAPRPWCGGPQRPPSRSCCPKTPLPPAASAPVCIQSETQISPRQRVERRLGCDAYDPVKGIGLNQMVGCYCCG